MKQVFAIAITYYPILFHLFLMQLHALFTVK